MLPLKPLPFILILFSALSSFGQTYKQYADSLRRAYHVPELSYAVVDIGSTIEIAALGRHAINRQDTATLNDRFHLGSNTKALTAFVIAHYVEKGNLQWTTRFFDLFPEWKAESNPAYTNITLQDLLSHRAGILPFQGIDDPPVPDFKGNARERRKQFGKWVLTLPPAPPDDQQPFVYSNAGYTLAALMLEKATGKSWEQTVEKVLNRKLKLHVGFSFPENQKHHDTWGHRQVNDSLVPVPSSAEEHLDFTEPAGDLNKIGRAHV